MWRWKLGASPDACDEGSAEYRSLSGGRTALGSAAAAEGELDATNSKEANKTTSAMRERRVMRGDQRGGGIVASGRRAECARREFGLGGRFREGISV